MVSSSFSTMFYYQAYVFLLLKFMAYVPKMPLWVETMPSLTCVNLKDFTSQTYLVLHHVKLSTTNVIFEKQEVNEMLCIKEVGVDLELCVHAHENDVDRLGSFLQNDYPAV